MSKDFEEFTAISEIQGPIVRFQWKPYAFSINCENSSGRWVTNPVKIVGAYATIGEANRAFLHKALDTFIDNWVGNTRVVGDIQVVGDPPR